MTRRLLGLMLVIGVALGAAACGDSDDGFTYDEAAHRAAVDELLGVTERSNTAESDAAWERYKDLARERCAETGIDYEALVAVSADEGLVETLRLDAEYVCPDKQDTLEQLLTELTH